VSANDGWLEVGATTRLGDGLYPHHLQRRAYVDRARGVIAVIRGYGGQSTGNAAVEIVAEELDRSLAAGGELVAAVTGALEAASPRLRDPLPPYSGGFHAGVTAVVIAPPLATVIHIGGGRAYLVRTSELRRLTADHRMDLGPTFAAHTVLSRALGGTDQLDVLELTVDGGDRLVVVDDTIARTIPEPELAEVVARSGAVGAADELVTRACARSTSSAAAAVATLGPRERL